MTQKQVEIGGMKFKKSSFSKWGDKCVGISIQGEMIFVANTKTDGPIVKFTAEEWQAFIAGVRNGEFDLGVA